MKDKKPEDGDTELAKKLTELMSGLKKVNAERAANNKNGPLTARQAQNLIVLENIATVCATAATVVGTAFFLESAYCFFGLIILANLTSYKIAAKK